MGGIFKSRVAFDYAGNRSARYFFDNVALERISLAVNCTEPF